MKTSIHPEYFESTIHCAGCNTTFTAGSTTQNSRVDICSNCHPFFTGQKKLVDTEGRVERFERRMSQKSEPRKPKKVVQPSSRVQTPQRASAPTPSEENRPKSLREMLQEAANNSR